MLSLSTLEEKLQFVNNLIEKHVDEWTPEEHKAFMRCVDDIEREEDLGSIFND